MPSQKDLSAGGHHDAGGQVQEGRFPAAAAADQGHGATAGHFEIDIVQNGAGRAALGGVGQADLFELEHRFFHGATIYCGLGFQPVPQATPMKVATA